MMLRSLRFTIGFVLVVGLFVPASAVGISCSDLKKIGDDWDNDRYSYRTIDYELRVDDELDISSCFLTVLSGGYVDTDGIIGQRSSLVLRGGEVTGDVSFQLGSLDVYDGVIGGTFEGMSTPVRLYGGAVKGDVALTSPESELRMLGGTVSGDVDLRNGAWTYLSAGQIRGDVSIETSAVALVDPAIHVSGFDFHLDGESIDHGLYAGPLSGELSGYWVRGQPFSFGIDVAGKEVATTGRMSYSYLHLATVPEPHAGGIASLLALVVFVGRLRRRHTAYPFSDGATDRSCGGARRSGAVGTTREVRLFNVPANSSRLVSLCQRGALLLVVVASSTAVANAEWLTCRDLEKPDGVTDDNPRNIYRSIDYELRDIDGIRTTECTVDILPKGYVEGGVGGIDSDLNLRGGVVEGSFGVSEGRVNLYDGTVIGNVGVNFGYLTVFDGLIDGSVTGWRVAMSFFGGEVLGDVLLDEEASLIMRDGLIAGDLDISTYGLARLEGGRILGTISLLTPADQVVRFPTLTVLGYGFRLDGEAIDEGTHKGPLTGELSGYWPHGERFSIDIDVGGDEAADGGGTNSSHLVLSTVVPEPAFTRISPLVCGLLLHCFRRRRKLRWANKKSRT